MFCQEYFNQDKNYGMKFYQNNLQITQLQSSQIINNSILFQFSNENIQNQQSNDQIQSNHTQISIIDPFLDLESTTQVNSEIMGEQQEMKNLNQMKRDIKDKKQSKKHNFITIFIRKIRIFLKQKCELEYIRYVKQHLKQNILSIQRYFIPGRHDYNLIQQLKKKKQCFQSINEIDIHKIKEWKDKLRVLIQQGKNELSRLFADSKVSGIEDFKKYSQRKWERITKSDQMKREKISQSPTYKL